MSEINEQSPWHNRVEPSHMPGCAYGSHFPSLILNFAGRPLTLGQRQALASWLDKQLPETGPAEPPAATEYSGDDWSDSVSLLLGSLHRLQTTAGLTVFEKSRVLAQGNHTARCLVSASSAVVPALSKALDWLFLCFGQWPEQPSNEALNAILAALRAQVYWAANIRRFASAALAMNIPFIEMPGQVFQYGLGRRGRWMNSSFTDFTPFISVGLVQNKQVTSIYLQQAGLPVPEQRVVQDETAALVAAEELGYPVVVKPLDQEGGLGVVPDLRSPEEMREPIAAIQRHANNILIEKHFSGRDYRLIIFHGEMIWAIECIPGGVTGDGQQTVAQLLEEYNANPLRGTTANFPLKQVEIDDEVSFLLAREQLTMASVPEKGRFVRLRRVNNISVGGTPVGVTEQVHPDNKLLAERAARVLRLDIAGVDLLIEDISRSWRETGAIICEVNSQPNLGQTTTGHLYAPMLNKIVPGNGRVPVILVLGAPAGSNLVEVLSRALSGRLDLVVGYHNQQGVCINGQPISQGPVSAYEAARMLTMEPTVGAMIISVNDLSAAWTGLPMRNYDLLLIAGPHIDTAGNTDRQTGITTVMHALLPGCDGQVLTLKEAGLQIRPPAGQNHAIWPEEPVPAAQLVERVVDIVTAAEARHQQPAALPDAPVNTTVNATVNATSGAASNATSH